MDQERENDMRRTELSTSLQALIAHHCTQQGMYKISVFDSTDVEHMDDQHLVGWSLCMVDQKRLSKGAKDSAHAFDQRKDAWIRIDAPDASYMAKVQPLGSFSTQ